MFDSGIHFRNNWASTVCITVLCTLGPMLYMLEGSWLRSLKALDEWMHRLGSLAKKEGINRKAIMESQPSVRLRVLYVAQLSTISASPVLGSPIARLLVDYMGCHRAIIPSNLIFCVGLAMRANSASNMHLSIIGRALTGFGVTAISGVMLGLQVDCAPKWWHGLNMGLLYGSIAMIGLTTVIAFKSVLKEQMLKGHRINSYMNTILVGWAVIVTVGIFMFPESPRWLVGQGDLDGATRSLTLLRGLLASDPDIQLEMNDILVELNGSKDYDLISGIVKFLRMLIPSRSLY
ncbi:hypothetical protein BDP27DRAFT_457994 [Rhodocollybia butyracea]|uniref:Major facilitator superfamily (MFS) profile domain-containing protein n=1 Tax=Rhodocollybia butyracea TaxID=206335 RepID=A0A9P5PT00_9AGAR|nr:hypothetical protein BDP27DRAFT_457994 [Rhodocollybia butyracea]